MPTATEVARVIAAIRAHLGPHVLRPDWRKRRVASAMKASANAARPAAS